MYLPPHTSSLSLFNLRYVTYEERPTVLEKQPIHRGPRAANQHNSFSQSERHDSEKEKKQQLFFCFSLVYGVSVEPSFLPTLNFFLGNKHKTTTTEERKGGGGELGADAIQDTLTLLRR